MNKEQLKPEIRSGLDAILDDAKDFLIEKLREHIRESSDDDLLLATEASLAKDKTHFGVTIGGLRTQVPAETARALVQEIIADRFAKKLTALYTFARMARACEMVDLADKLQSAYDFNAPFLDKKELQND